MSASAHETCICGAEFSATVNEAYTASTQVGYRVDDFRAAHKVCREAWAASLTGTAPAGDRVEPVASDDESGRKPLNLNLGGTK